MQILILSDIHGNLSALKSVLNDVREKHHPDTTVILGDNIDYGMRSNEVVEVLQKFPYPICCSIWGNHERAILSGDFTGFSSRRGVECAKYTKKNLNQQSIMYLNDYLEKSGKKEFMIGTKKVLAVHGSLKDSFWKSIMAQGENKGYEDFDYVLSGHSHVSHVFPVFYDIDDPVMRNRKKTLFINPGSVGQPRNHCNKAQYAILDFEEGIQLCEIPYDIDYEMALYHGQVDDFYRERLQYGV